jgi:hypothetical protein
MKGINPLKEKQSMTINFFENLEWKRTKLDDELDAVFAPDSRKFIEQSRKELEQILDSEEGRTAFINDVIFGSLQSGLKIDNDELNKLIRKYYKHHKQKTA